MLPADGHAPGALGALRRFGAALARDLPGGVIAIKVDSTSMLPVLCGGCRVAWRRLDGPPAPGDLLLSIDAKVGPVVHRVLGLRGGAALTKGDARPAADLELVPADDWVGVVVAIERDGAVVSLEGAHAAWYAAAATDLSQRGHWIYRAAALGDALLRRALFEREDRRRLKARAASRQAAAAERLYRLHFARCHAPLERLPFDRPPFDHDAAP